MLQFYVCIGVAYSSIFRHKIVALCNVRDNFQKLKFGH